MKLSWPLPPECKRITQRFGANPDFYREFGLAGHEGLDIACDTGTPVFATHDGLAEAAWGPIYGDQVRVRGEGVLTLYAHLLRATVRGVQEVRAGDTLGLSGSTGRSTGPHLHFGLQIDGVANAEYKGWLDPEPYLREMSMPSKLSFQVQRCGELRNPDHWVVHHIKEAGVWAVVLIDPDVLGTYNPFPGVYTLGRLIFNGDPDLALVKRGGAGAREYVAMCAPRQDAAPWIRLWQAPNEPFTGDPENPNDLDPMNRLTEFTVELVHLNRQRGIDTAVGVFSTSVPAGPKANPSPTIERKWEIFGPACHEAAVLVLHEYGMDTLNPTPENEWHIGHYKRGVKALQDAGFRVPPIWITEHGIDRGGGQTTDGWRVKLGGNEVEYMRQLAVRDAEYSAAPVIQNVTPFVWLDWNWPSFTIIESMSGRIVAHVKAKGAYRPGEMPTPPPVGPVIEGFTQAEREEARVQFEKHPATMKASNWAGYVWQKEWKFGGFYFALVYLPEDHKYKVLKLDPQTWQVVAKIDL